MTLVQKFGNTGIWNSVGLSAQELVDRQVVRDSDMMIKVDGCDSGHVAFAGDGNDRRPPPVNVRTSVRGLSHAYSRVPPRGQCGSRW